MFCSNWHGILSNRFLSKAHKDQLEELLRAREVMRSTCIRKETFGTDGMIIFVPVDFNYLICILASVCAFCIVMFKMK